MEMEKKDIFVITIGRQIGSGGRYIAEQLAKKLAIPVYDKMLLQEAAKSSGLDTSAFEKVDEKESKSIFASIFGFRGTMASYSAGSEGCIDDDKLFYLQSETIRTIAEREACIIVGRCSEYVLRDHPRMVSIFITADKDERVRRIMEYEKIDEAKAIEFMEKGDKRRRSYHDYYATHEWGAAKSYDICINSSRLGLDGTIEFLHSFVKQRFAI